MMQKWRRARDPDAHEITASAGDAPARGSKGLINLRENDSKNKTCHIAALYECQDFGRSDGLWTEENFGSSLSISSI